MLKKGCLSTPSLNKCYTFQNNNKGPLVNSMKISPSRVENISLFQLC